MNDSRYSPSTSHLPQSQSRFQWLPTPFLVVLDSSLLPRVTPRSGIHPEADPLRLDRYLKAPVAAVWKLFVSVQNTRFTSSFVALGCVGEQPVDMVEFQASFLIWTIVFTCTLL